MGVTMYLQQKLNPQPTDPVQARVFQFLPILFTFMLAPFAAGLGDLLGLEQHALDRAAVHDHAPPRRAHRQQGALRRRTRRDAPRSTASDKKGGKGSGKKS